jgi:WD40 repeat protein
VIVGRFEGHHSTIRTVVWSEDGGEVYSGSEDGEIRKWKVVGPSSKTK